jgi:murein DD-endopeptidase MepM/ murein hydrolase activator NlpD
MKYNRYIQPASKARSKRFFSPAIFFILFTLVTLFGYFFLTSEAPVEISTPTSPAFEQPAPPKPEQVPPPKVEYTNHKSVIHSGDTVTRLLGDQLQPQEILSMVAACKKVFPLRKIAVGHPYTIVKKDGEFHKLVYEINADEQLVVCKQGDAFTSQTVPIEYDVRPSVVDGTIQSSLFAAVTHTGEDASLAYRLADMFAWDIDFIRDIREGDKFRVLVEKRYREGKFAGYGHIKAAEFINQGHPHRGFLFKDAEGRLFHYDEDGKSLRKAFLKAPLNFRRISSKYTMRRLHPIYKVYRPHQGIDYAAAMGTPVWAVGDGTVSHVGWKGAAGRMIKIRHGGKYETYYLHLRRYAKGLKVGSRVRQGQVIGYVGSSGASTGPHLDFRMKKYGKYVNPMNVKTPSARSISKERMPEFKVRTQKLLASLDAMDGAAQTAHSDVTSHGETEKKAM